MTESIKQPAASDLSTSAGYTIPNGTHRQDGDVQSLCDWLDENKSCRFVDELRNELTKRNDEWCGRDKTY